MDYVFQFYISRNKLELLCRLLVLTKAPDPVQKPQLGPRTNQSGFQEMAFFEESGKSRLRVGGLRLWMSDVD